MAHPSCHNSPMKMKLKRFNKRHFLARIGRDLLARFFESFRDDFNANQLPLPPPDLPDADYINALLRLLLHPEGLPDRLNEALFAIDDISSPQGIERLQAAPEWSGLQPMLKPDSTCEDLALQLWLVAPSVLARVHNALRLRRLTAFEHAATRLPKDQRPPFDPTDKMAIVALTQDLDAWFARNQRGAETTRIEVYPMDGEFWFLIRHGDIFTRASKVEQQNTEILHFRPERDDVVVYSPERDEVRVNARTKGERDLYIAQFGLRLRATVNYFCERSTYTLEPLRTEGPDSLDVREIEGLEKVVLRELEVVFDGGNREVVTRAVQGLFEFAAASNQPEVIPQDGRLARAIFDLQFAGCAKAHPVEVRLPNMLKVSRSCDAQLVQSWLARNGFRRDSNLNPDLNPDLSPSAP